eukprot:619385-Rhodomonas_salina.5
MHACICCVLPLLAPVLARARVLHPTSSHRLPSVHASQLCSPAGSAQQESAQAPGLQSVWEELAAREEKGRGGGGGEAGGWCSSLSARLSSPCLSSPLLTSSLPASALTASSAGSAQHSLCSADEAGGKAGRGGTRQPPLCSSSSPLASLLWARHGREGQGGAGARCEQGERELKAGRQRLVEHGPTLVAESKS